METLTKTEEKIMQVIWDLKRGFVKDVIDRLGEPAPPYNTVSSLIRILEKKGFVGYKAYGKTHEYFPLISKLAYRSFTFRNFVANYFDGASGNVLSFMLEEQDLSPEEIEKAIREIKKTKTDDAP
ncbi:putative transcriptional regulator [Dyadobacter sp. BE34]|uniref:Transcriptional regulator n=1 Tax=Dyadobacter fermentans TaxID=94254 RepID=A0ABU1QWB2_9BACT|nr:MULTISPECIES: BlaI/MecI/CopY family transcriptional regulator [Dyadobacter]MDR6804924.1 putative transcriptional regulator [Dyadobacter fermentans]MDR7043317.1 putative transcriptional regulator [Dyadobacter sp. BE242]MDR7197629.1 putative transcriptional regulator [Dyadobacter sp. BE34]MDR7214938.1 putative transcriptional regulator [Dyadobacter sp. BE31]MDR7262473.1 putative transcriptional regulator [Dyadobacter sp. BE32]